MADPSKVLSEALDLPVQDRLRIATALLRSVDPEEDEDAEQAWVAEINRRSAEAASETVPLVDGETVFARIRENLRARRALRK